MNQEDILQILVKLDRELTQRDQEMTLIIVGYSAVILAGLHDRGTEDIDALETGNSRLLYKFGLHLLPEHYLHFHPNYRERLQPIHASFTNLHAYYLHLLDLCLVKLDAGREKDIRDLKYFIEHGFVRRRDLDPLFEEWKRHWYPDFEDIRELYERLWRE